MAIQAISSVTNKGYSNISFGKRGEKPVKNHNVTSPMKAVPLAVLIAMSPLTTTNAENIMRAENNANTIELAQNPQSRVLMYAEGFTSQNGTKVAVMAFNTKGGTDSFDQILLKAGEFTFEAKDLVDREIYLYTGNKGKEGPLTYKEVIAETEIEGKKERFSFLDPNIVNYVEAIVSQPTNQSNLQGIRKAHNNLIIANSKGDLLFVDDEYLNADIFLDKPLVGLSVLNQLYPPDEYEIFIAVGYKKINTIREQIFNKVKEKGYKCVSYIHPTAVIAKDFVLNENTFILENVTIQPNVQIGQNTIIFPNAVVCHDSKIGANSFIASSVCINGFVEAGSNIFLGANSTIRNNISIGNKCLVGAGCTVLKDLKDNSVCKSAENIFLNLNSWDINV